MVLLFAVTYLFYPRRRHLGHRRFRWAGASPSSTLSGGSASATPGTLISAILLLLKQSWRNSINRFAEAMTLFAVACAGMFPVMHTWPSLAGLLAVPLSEHHGRVAAVPQPAGVGRLRGFDLRDHLRCCSGTSD